MLRLLKDNQPEAALRLVDEEIESLTGFDTDTLCRLSHQDLVTGPALLETDADVHAKRLLLTTLLGKAGEIHDLLGHEDAHVGCLLTALELRMDTPHAIPDGLPVAIPIAADLAEALNGYLLPPATNLRLFRYYEENSLFADAEDQFFSMLDEEPESPELLELGIAFYERLLNLPDDVLEEGGLPREEVVASLEEIKGLGD
ncbi:MAG: DUF6483 family protein [Caldilineaceae bacterium]